MLLDHKNLRRTLLSLDKSRVLRIFCNRNLHSICALAIFTQVLKKDLFKYEIEFRNMQKSKILYFEADGIEYILSTDLDLCSCPRKEITGVIVLYNVIKSMNLVKNETIWPVAICFSYYRQFSNESAYTDFENKENLENIKNPRAFLCPKCEELQEEISFSIKFLNCKSEGIFAQRKNRLDFLQKSTLFQCICTDLRFIHQKKLFYTKIANLERRIGEFLAKRGISLKSSHEPYMSLEAQIKDLCTDAFGEFQKYIMKSGHDIEINASEHAFLILFYLYKEKDMYSYMCLERRKLIDLEKASKFYQKAVFLFKEAVLTANRVGKIVIFRVKNEDFSIDQIIILSDIITGMLRIYLTYRNETGSKIVLHYDQSNEEKLLYSEDLVLNDDKNDVNIKIIKKEDMTVFLRKFVI